MDIRVLFVGFAMTSLFSSSLYANDMRQMNKMFVATATWAAEWCAENNPDLSARFEAALDALKAENADLVPLDYWSTAILSDDMKKSYEADNPEPTHEFCSKVAEKYEGQHFHATFRGIFISMTEKLK